MTELLIFLALMLCPLLARAQDAPGPGTAAPDADSIPQSFMDNFPLQRPPITMIEPDSEPGESPTDIEFDQPPEVKPPAQGLEFDTLVQPAQPKCTPKRVAFDKRYQERVNLFADRKLLKEKDYFATPYVARGVRTPQLTDVIYDFTLVINQDDLNRGVQAFKEQTAAYTATGTWTPQEVRRAIDEGASFDVCLPIPEYALDPAPAYKFIMNKTTLKLHLYQKYGGKDVLLSTFDTTKGGVNRDATSGTARGFPTPSGDFWVKRIGYAPSYIHPDWSSDAGVTEKPGFFNPYGIVMAEIWKTANPLCNAKKDKCDGYNWTYTGGTGIRFHTSNRDSNVRNSKGQPRPSHGCNRLFTRDGKRIFTLLYFKVPHAECKTVTRGTVCPFVDTVIPYHILEK